MESTDSRLNKGTILMCLALAGLHRARAAALAGVSDKTFRRAMKRCRVQAPRSDAVLTAADVAEIRLLLEKHTINEVAEMKGCHRRTIEQVSSYQTWYWVK